MFLEELGQFWLTYLTLLVTLGMHGSTGGGVWKTTDESVTWNDMIMVWKVLL